MTEDLGVDDDGDDHDERNCSDVSGAFDRVFADVLVAKLVSTGLHLRSVRVLRSWFADRTAVVVVKGVASDPCILRNSVFQGTVWGPPL